MPKQVRVNVRSLANTKAARHETRNGREVVIVPSATMPDNIVMNGILYPADEIEASFRSLNRTPAPHGHPMIGNNFISAKDPEGINLGYIGAWNENARRENGRVFLDKVIDVTVASRSDEGNAVLAAINAGDPVHTSTGLLADLEEAGENDGHKFVARNIEFDHDAILLNEEGAATPEQGVGMMVNAKTGEEIEVINSAIEWADRDLDWAVTSVVDALDRRERAGLVDRIKSALIEAFTPMRDTTENAKEDEMSDEQLNALSEKVDAIEESLNGIADKITDAVTNAIKPVKDHVDQIAANQKAQDDAELEGLRDKIVKANLMDEETAKELTLNAARKLAEKAKPGKAAALNGAFDGKSDDNPWAGYSLNAHAKTEEAK